MSQQKTKRKKKAKIKKVSYKDKDWYEVISPQTFNFKNIGEIIGLENSIQNRTVETLLFDFTGDFNDINLKLKFKVSTINYEAKKCDTLFIGHQYTNDYIRSLVGRGASKISTIQNLTTRDGFVFRITTICVTIKRALSSQQVVIRKIMTDILKEFAKSLNHEMFIHGMIYGEFQNQIARVAKTIYPLSSSTIVKSKLISFPEGVEDKIVESKQFDIVEIDVKRIRKSDIKRTERINVKKFTRKAPSNRGNQTPVNEKKLSDESKKEKADNEKKLSDESKKEKADNEKKPSDESKKEKAED